MIGPVFFTLLQTSLTKGFGKAALVAVGVSLGDVLLIFLTYFGLSQFIGFEDNKELIGYAGAAILAVFGVFSLWKATKAKRPIQRDDEIRGFFRFIFKGLAINAISPFVPIFWIGTMSLATIEYGYKGSDLVLFFAVIIAVVLTTDLAKAFLAIKLSSFLNERVLRLLNVVVGVVLLLFALRMATYEW